MIKNTSIFSWLGFIFAYESHYDNIAPKKQLFIKKFGQNLYFPYFDIYIEKSNIEISVLKNIGIY